MRTFLVGLFVALLVIPTALAQGDLNDSTKSTTLEGNPTTPSGDVIAPIYEKIIWASIAVFVLVAIVLTYILIRFRHRKGKKVDVPQVHGNSKLEIAWTIGPALVMIWLLVISYDGLIAIDNPGVDPEVYVGVEAARFFWTFTYTDGEKVSGAAPIMRVQEDTWVQLNVTSTDVIHAIAIPGLDVIIDANPGRPNKVMFYAREPGTYLVQCRQFCGEGHGDMIAGVEVFPTGTQSKPFGSPPRPPVAQPPADGNNTTAPPADITLQIRGFDFEFSPVPAAVEPGQTVEIVFVNEGPSAHNLYLGTFADNKGTVQCADPADESTCWKTEFGVATGETDTFRFIAPSEPVAFDLWCDIPGHAALGMLSHLSVGGAVPGGAPPTEPRLPGPGAALLVAAILGLALVARRLRA